MENEGVCSTGDLKREERGGCGEGGEGGGWGGSSISGVFIGAFLWVTGLYWDQEKAFYTNTLGTGKRGLRYEHVGDCDEAVYTNTLGPR